MAPSVVAGPGRKALIVGCSIIAVIGAGYMFSGRQIPFMHHDQPSERPIEVQMNGPITRLDKPVEQLPPSRSASDRGQGSRTGDGR